MYHISPVECHSVNARLRAVMIRAITYSAYLLQLRSLNIKGEGVSCCLAILGQVMPTSKLKDNPEI